ncbi:MAG: hypothetical protein IV107_11710 [Paucibacter sp.]|nr:hypothetical protein [Roseateles sp.]
MGWVQNGLSSRFVDRLQEAGGIGVLRNPWQTTQHDLWLTSRALSSAIKLECLARRHGSMNGEQYNTPFLGMLPPISSTEMLSIGK